MSRNHYFLRAVLAGAGLCLILSPAGAGTVTAAVSANLVFLRAFTINTPPDEIGFGGRVDDNMYSSTTGGAVVGYDERDSGFEGWPYPGQTVASYGASVTAHVPVGGSASAGLQRDVEFVMLSYDQLYESWPPGINIEVEWRWRFDISVSDLLTLDSSVSALLEFYPAGCSGASINSLTLESSMPAESERLSESGSCAFRPHFDPTFWGLPPVLLDPHLYAGVNLTEGTVLAPAQVPLPAAGGLLGAAILAGAGLSGASRRRKRSA